MTLKDFTPGRDHISDRSGSRSEREEEKGNSGGSLPWKECSPDPLRRPVQEPAVHLKWQHMIWELGTTYLDPSGSQIGQKGKH